MATDALGAAVAAFVLCAILIAVSKPILARLAVDLPNDRSSHVLPTPRGGGLSVATAAVFITLIAVDIDARLVVVAAALGGLACLGFIDDVRSLAPGPRLALQVALGLLAAGAAIDSGADWSYRLAVGAAVLLIVASVNAFNFMDGINGISAATAVVAAGWYWWLGAANEERFLVVMSMTVLGASLAFVLWNASGALFLGDSGSYFLGGALAVLAIVAIEGGAEWWRALAPFGPYAADTGFTVVRRAARRIPLTQAHREHVYQQLVALGTPHLKVAGLVATATATCCGISLVPWLPGVILLWAAVALVYLSSPWLSARADRLRV